MKMMLCSVAVTSYNFFPPLKCICRSPRRSPFLQNYMKTMAQSTVVRCFYPSKVQVASYQQVRITIAPHKLDSTTKRTTYWGSSPALLPSKMDVSCFCIDSSHHPIYLPSYMCKARNIMRTRVPIPCRCKSLDFRAWNHDHPIDHTMQLRAEVYSSTKSRAGLGTLIITHPISPPRPRFKPASPVLAFSPLV